MAPEKPPLTSTFFRPRQRSCTSNDVEPKELPWLSVTREASVQQGRERRDLDTGLPPPHADGLVRIWCDKPGQRGGGRGAIKPQPRRGTAQLADFPNMGGGLRTGEADGGREGPGHVGSHSTQNPALSRQFRLHALRWNPNKP